MKRVSIFVAASTLLVLAMVGCGSNGNSTKPTSASGQSQMLVTMGDAPSDRVIAFALTVNTMTLTGGTNPTVVSSPTRIEFVRDAGTFQPLVSAKIPSGTYTGATISVSNPQVVTIDTTTHAPVQLTPALSNSTVTVTFNTPLTVTATTVEADFDLDLANSVTISGNTATINPVFHVSSKVVRDQDNDDFKDVRGVVNSVSSPSFTVTSVQAAQMFTFATDSNTIFRGVTGLSQLTAGMIVEVDAKAQADGSLLAKRIEVDADSDDGISIEGFTTATTGTPATSFTLTEEFESSFITALLNSLGVGNSITVNVGANTTFAVSDDGRLDNHDGGNGGHGGDDGGDVDLTGLSVNFDAKDIGKAQRVEATAIHQAAFQSSGLVLTADRVRLLQQSLSGTVSNVTGSTTGTFTLTVAGDSAFALLSGQTTLTVQLVNGTLEDMTVANGATVRTRGLLFFNGTANTYTLVASRVGQQ